MNFAHIQITQGFIYSYTAIGFEEELMAKTAVKVVTCMSNYISHASMDVIIYPCPNLGKYQLVKEIPGTSFTNFNPSMDK